MIAFFLIALVSFLMPGWIEPSEAGPRSGIVLGDRYQNFAALAEDMREGYDYQIRIKNRGSLISVLAIHGGWLEFYTTELATELAGDQFNLYSFMGTIPPAVTYSRGRSRNWDLHITSNNYDEPQAVTLVERSVLTVSLHGYHAPPGDLAVCIGGANIAAASRVARMLQLISKEVRVDFPCQRFPGLNPKNIANRALQGGVQLELSWPLRQELMANDSLRQRFLALVRQAMAHALQPAIEISLASYCGLVLQPDTTATRKKNQP